MGLCALCWHWDHHHPSPASPGTAIHHQSQPRGCPQSPHPCHLITSHGCSPQDAASTPPSVSKENQPPVVSPPLLPLQAVFLLLSSFHQAANMLSEQ